MIPAGIGLFIYKWTNVARGNDDAMLFIRQHLQDSVTGWQKKPEKEWTLHDLIGKHGMDVIRTYVNLIGCDYINNIPHVGPQTAIDILKQTSSLRSNDIVAAIRRYNGRNHQKIHQSMPSDYAQQLDTALICWSCAWAYDPVKKQGIQDTDILNHLDHPVPLSHLGDIVGVLPHGELSEWCVGGEVDGECFIRDAHSGQKCEIACGTAIWLSGYDQESPLQLKLRGNRVIVCTGHEDDSEEEDEECGNGPERIRLTAKVFETAPDSWGKQNAMPSEDEMLCYLASRGLHQIKKAELLQTCRDHWVNEKAALERGDAIYVRDPRGETVMEYFLSTAPLCVQSMHLSSSLKPPPAGCAGWRRGQIHAMAKYLPGLDVSTIYEYFEPKLSNVASIRGPSSSKVIHAGKCRVIRLATINQFAWHGSCTACKECSKQHSGELSSIRSVLDHTERVCLGVDSLCA